MYFWVVYGLRARGSFEYRYIGITTKGPGSRLRAHKKAARGSRKLPVYDWIRSPQCGVHNLMIDVLEVCPIGDLRTLAFREQFWIAALREAGYPLLNLTDGGEGPTGYKPSEEQRKRQSEVMKGRRHSPDVYERIAKKQRGVPKHSDEQRKKWSEERRGSITGEKNPNYSKFGEDHPAYGRVYSDETLKRLSEAKRGSKNPNFGKTYSEEERAELSRKIKGRKNPKSKMSAHKRYHVNLPGYSDKCQYCLESGA